jgi:hypothetical protein
MKPILKNEMARLTTVADTGLGAITALVASYLGAVETASNWRDKGPMLAALIAFVEAPVAAHKEAFRAADGLSRMNRIIRGGCLLDPYIVLACDLICATAHAGETDARLINTLLTIEIVERAEVQRDPTRTHVELCQAVGRALASLGHTTKT